ncbi:hypothetical protein J3D55_003280 [Chryseobacterium ginsenosidimutans]|nr:hypothetical protein [Chryseobacterium ginsenosidimutans]
MKTKSLFIALSLFTFSSLFSQKIFKAIESQDFEKNKQIIRKRRRH